MVSVLIDLRATIGRHRLQRTSRWVLVAVLAFGLLSALGTLTLGVLHGNRIVGALDAISAVLALWLGGQWAQAAINGGESALRPEMLALLPVSRRRLAWSLLAVGLCDPALAFVAVADAAVVGVAVDVSVPATLVAVGGIAGLLVLTGVGAVVVGGILGPGAHRGRDLGTFVVAVAISVLAVAGTLLPTVLSALRDGRWSGLAAIVRWLPSGWPGDAVAAVHRGAWAVAIGLMLAPLGPAVLLAVAWSPILGRRMTITGATAPGPGRPRHGRLLPATPTGAVAAKEIRLWLRDPVRVTCLLIALIVGGGVGLVPKFVSGSSLLMPFAGPLTVVIAGACACNLYGNDGTSLWLTILTPDAARADVRGRQLAWLALVIPAAIVETVGLTIWSGEHALWPWAAALVVALTGGAAGLAPLASLISVQPLDDGGNPTPAFSLKVQVALYANALTALPAAGALALGDIGGWPLVSWLAVAVAIVTAAGAVVGLGIAAIGRLRARAVEVLAVLAAAT